MKCSFLKNGVFFEKNHHRFSPLNDTNIKRPPVETCTLCTNIFSFLYAFLKVIFPGLTFSGASSVLSFVLKILIRGKASKLEHWTPMMKGICFLRPKAPLLFSQVALPICFRTRKGGLLFVLEVKGYVFVVLQSFCIGIQRFSNHPRLIGDKLFRKRVIGRRSEFVPAAGRVMASFPPSGPLPPPRIVSMGGSKLAISAAGRCRSLPLMAGAGRNPPTVSLGPGPGEALAFGQERQPSPQTLVFGLS